MSVTVGDLLVKLSLENAQYKSELEKSRQQTQRDTDFMSKGAELVGKAWQVAGPVIVASLTAAGAAIVKSIDLASDLNETTSKTGVVFGTAADDILDFSTTTAGALGQTQQQALDAASTFGIFGKSAGLAGADLSDFAIDLTTLASDLASFHNASPEEAITAIGAALRGESEPLRRFGVLLDDATLKAKAMEMGIINTTSNALTPQQKVLAAYNVIMEQTVDAQGDFARTSDGLANTQRVLKAELTDLATEWGTALLPIVQEFAGEAVPTLIDGLKVLTESRLPTFVTLVGKAADVILEAFDAGMLLITWSDRVDMALEEQQNNLMQTSDGYDDYAAGMISASLAAGDLTERQAELLNIFLEGGSAMDEMEQATSGRFTPTMLELMQTIKLTDEATYNLTQRQYQLATDSELADKQLMAAARSAVQMDGDYQNAATATQDLAAEQDALKAQLSDLQLFIQGPLGGELDDFKTKQDELKTKAGELAEKIGVLESKEYLTAAQKEELATLRGDLDETNGALNDNASAHEDATRRIVFSLLTQRAAMDGLTSQELTLLNDMALKWGLVDQATHDAVESIDGALTDLANGESIVEVEQQIMGIDDALVLTNEHMQEKGVGAMNDYEEKMRELGEPVETFTDQVGSLADEALHLVTQLNAIPSNIDINIATHYTSTGDPTIPVGPDGKGDPHMAGLVIDTGEIPTGNFDPFATLMGNSSLGFATTSGKLAGTFAGMLGNEDAKARLDALDKEIELASSYDERLWLEQQRADLVKEIAANEEKVAALKEKQQDMAFLQSQLELVKLAKETGADIGQFAGKLGKDASIEDLLTATTDIFDQMVNQANDALLGWGIAGDGGQGALGEPRKSGRGGGRGRFGDPRGDKGGGGATAFGGSFGGGGDKSGSGVERFGFGGPGSGLQMAGGGKWIHIEHLYVQADDAMSLVEQLYELAD